MSTKVLVPSGVLGLGFSEKALEKGLERNPDIICIDGGSTDSGPFYLGTGRTKYSEEICKQEWRVLMQARHRLNIPLMIGSCGTCGTNSMVDWMFQLTLEIAKELGQDLKIIRVYCERKKDALVTALRSNAIKPLNPILSVNEEEIETFSNIVAASANWGIAFGETKDETSILGKPASIKLFIISILSSVFKIVFSD